MRIGWWGVVFGVGLLCAVGAKAEAGAVIDDIGHYPLDARERELAPGAALPCGGDGLVTYRGERFRYARPARVHPAFRDRLRAFEGLVVQTAAAHYGRAPAKLLHLGTLSCRRIRLYPGWISEHALGNAIDVAGFVFGPLPRGQQLPAGLPAGLRAGFEVRVDAHWSATRGAGTVHSAFLRDLARRVIAQRDLFRTVLGPAYPGHRNHFHLDCAPYRVVDVF